MISKLIEDKKKISDDIKESLFIRVLDQLLGSRYGAWTHELSDPYITNYSGLDQVGINVRFTQSEFDSEICFPLPVANEIDIREMVKIVDEFILWMDKDHKGKI